MADREQQQVIRTIIAEGRRRGLPRQAILSALATGSVESRFRNLPGGDRDSQGWRQERRQFYSNPRNIRAAVGRYYDEWEVDARGRGLSIGQQAQAVQQSGFPDRYQTRVPLAKRLLRRYGGTRAGANTTSTITRQVPGIDNSGLRQDLKLQYLANRDDPNALLSLAQGLAGAQDIPGSVTTTKRTTRSARGGRDRFPGGVIHEAFYDPAGKYFDSGQFVKGGIGGHSNHVHVAASPKYVVWLGRQAQKMGLRVSENPAFDPVDPVHTQGSFHYRNRAIDVSGDPRKMARFYRFVLDAARHQ